MDKERFVELVTEAVRDLPEEFQDRLENIDVVVEDRPSPYQLSSSNIRRGYTLLGLYEGVPLTERSTYYGMVPPDKITIFQKPIEQQCESDDEIRQEVQRVVRHEIAHHFGISDARLNQLEKRNKRRPR